MLMLLFRVGAEPWAIAASEVREVVPLVAIQAMHGYCSGKTFDNLSGSSAGSVGLMTYRGETIPVVDVPMLLSGRPAEQTAEQTLDTRIVIVDCDRPTGSSSNNSASNLASDSADKQSRQRTGLIVKQANETARLAPVDVPVSGYYVESTWQVEGRGEVVYKLATERLVMQVHSAKKSAGSVARDASERAQLNGLERLSFQTVVDQTVVDQAVASQTVAGQTVAGQTVAGQTETGLSLAGA